jgi:hypothetical protein
VSDITIILGFLTLFPSQLEATSGSDPDPDPDASFISATMETVELSDESDHIQQTNTGTGSTTSTSSQNPASGGDNPDSQSRRRVPQPAPFASFKLWSDSEEKKDASGGNNLALARTLPSHWVSVLYEDSL